MGAFMTNDTKAVFDVSSLAIIGATFVEWLPAIASGLAVVWWLLRIYETKTVQRWLRRKP